MTISFHDSLSNLIRKTVDLLWHQWSSIGVAGYARDGVETMIDPEALILATTRFGRYDSRLMDESIDWLVQYGERISLQRLQGLNKNWPSVAEPRVLAAIAEVVCQKAGHRKWRTVAECAPGDGPAEPLFLSHDGVMISHFRESDSIFAKKGLMRGKLELRGMSQPPDPRNPQNLLFTLRALLGVNARAEIMAWLLTYGGGHPAAIARSTGYFSKSIQQILNEMEGSGQVGALRIGREKQFRLLRQEEWRTLLSPPSAKYTASLRWLDWMPIFAIITRMAETLAIPGLQEKSQSFQAIKFREALDDLQPAINRIAVAHNWRTTRDLSGVDLVQSLLADLEALIP